MSSDGARGAFRNEKNKVMPSSAKGSFIEKSDAQHKYFLKYPQKNSMDIIPQGYPESVFKFVSGMRMTSGEARGTTVPKDIFPLRIHVLRQTASLFGHNAPRKISINTGTLSVAEQSLVDDDQTGYVYLFTWERIPETDKDGLIKFLKDKFNIDSENMNINRDNNKITVNYGGESLSLELIDESNEVKLICNGVTTHLEVKEANGEHNIYQKEDSEVSKTGILHLDSTYNKILPESWAIVKREKDDATSDKEAVAEYLLISKIEKVTSGISRSAYDMSGKTTSIVLKRNDVGKILNNFAELRQTVIYAQSEDLTAKLAEESIEADVKGKVLELDGYYEGLEKGRSLIVSGQARAGTGTIIAAAEKVVLADTWHGLLTTMPGTPAPQIELSNDKKSISVNRWEAYSKELFEEAPEFATCGKGATPRRTCVQVKKWDGSVNGIPDIIADISTDIDYSKGLEKLDFPIGSNIDSGFIFLELRDRAKNVSYISNLVEKELYVFSWTKDDNTGLKEFLGNRYDIGWLNNATITKIDDKKTICMSNDGATLSLTLNNGESEVILKIDNIETDKFIARMENNVLNFHARLGTHEHENGAISIYSGQSFL